MRILTTSFVRYDMREVLGQGGMGVVYSAYDKVVKRLVAVKTVRDRPDPLALELFRRETKVLADLCHPNIVEVFDIGEFSENGFKKPYFVMPLLRGVTLDRLMKNSPEHLTPARCIDVISQTCRGLYVAHESGLIHRDLKPSNLFILEDDSVKIIDFGVAHLTSIGSTTGVKGTAHYLAPEQIEAGGASPLSDQFSLAVVAYQMLTRTLPFDGSSAREVSRSILNQIPTPVFERNPNISRAVAQVIAKALAKMPSRRFTNVREFSDCLQGAFHRNATMVQFEESRVLPRIERAERALTGGNLAFASEIVADLEDEGSLHTGISALRRKLEQEKKRVGVERLVSEASHRLQEDEFFLALQKVDEALALDPDNTELGSLKTDIETQRDSVLIAELLDLALQSRTKRNYQQARGNLEQILRLRPADAEVRVLLAEIKQDEADYRAQVEQRDRLHQSAFDAWREGDFAVAQNRMERARKLDPDGGDTEFTRSCRKFQEEFARFNQAQSESQKKLASGDPTGALEICDTWLRQYPGQPSFQAQRLNALGARRQQLANYIAEIENAIQAEDDLARRVQLFEQAAARFPDEPYFQNALREARERRDLIAQLVRKAESHENAAEWSEALETWRLTGEIYGSHPLLAEAVQRLRKKQEQCNIEEEKERWLRQIQREMAANRWESASDLLRNALKKFKDDPDLEELEQRIESRGYDPQPEAANLYSKNAPVIDPPPGEANEPKRDERTPRTPAGEMSGEQRKRFLETVPTERTNEGNLTGQFSAQPKRSRNPIGRYVFLAQKYLVPVTLLLCGIIVFALILRISLSHHAPSPAVSNKTIVRTTRPASKPATMAPPPDSPPPPAPPGPPVQVFADLPDANVIVDGAPGESLVDGILTLKNLTQGAHSVTISTPDGYRAVFQIDTGRREMPSAPELSGENITAILGELSGGKLKLSGNGHRVAVSLDRGRVTRLSQVDSLDIAPGPHTLRFAEGTDAWSTSLDDGAATQFIVVLHRSRGGVLLIATGEDRAAVTLDGYGLRRLSRNGRFRIINLPSRSYKVTVSKEGFENRSGMVEVQSGKEAVIDLSLTKKKPQFASLQVERGVAGAEVLIDGTSFGQTNPSGGFVSSHLSPGQHQIRITKNGFEPKAFTRAFSAGEQVVISGTDAILEPQPKAPAALRLEVFPAQADVTLKGSGGVTTHLHNGGPNMIPPGRYTLLVSADGFISQSQDVEFVPGENRQFALRLSPHENRVAISDMLAGWTDSASWTRDNNEMVHRGGGVLAYTRSPLAGTIKFTAELRKGKRLQWFITYKSQTDLCRFEADRQYLYRSRVVNGNPSQEVKKSYLGGDGKHFNVQISIAKGSATTRMNGQVVDVWNDSAIDFSAGKFGFIVPGRNIGSLFGGPAEIGLETFSFAP